MEPAFRARASGPPGVSKERGVQRPPVYNSEDYTEYLRKYCKFTGLQVRDPTVCQVGVFVKKIGVTLKIVVIIVAILECPIEFDQHIKIYEQPRIL